MFLCVDHLNPFFREDFSESQPVERIDFDLSKPPTLRLKGSPGFDDLSDLLGIGSSFLSPLQGMRVNANLQQLLAPHLKAFSRLRLLLNILVA
jgi:hypothetical protein